MVSTLSVCPPYILQDCRRGQLLNSAWEFAPQCIHEFSGQFLEAWRVWMQLVGPIGCVKHALCVDEDEFICRIARERDQPILEFRQRSMDDGGALREIVSAKIKRRLEPWSRAQGMRPVLGKS
jgi:hypothetical protein